MTVAPAALTIRAVTIDDLDSLIDVYLDTAVHHAAIDPEVFHVPSREAVAVRLRHRIAAAGHDSAYVAAIVDDRIVGSAVVDIETPPEPSAMLRAVPTAIFGVSVVAGSRGQGIGRALIEHVEGWARARGVVRMTLAVSEANPGAIRLYESMGYRRFDRLMLKPLPAP